VLVVITTAVSKCGGTVPVGQADVPDAPSKGVAHVWGSQHYFIPQSRGSPRGRFSAGVGLLIDPSSSATPSPPVNERSDEGRKL